MSRESKNELSKKRILEAALVEFGQNDYVSASTNTLCKNHHISKGLLFHYYQSKEELFLICVEKCFNELRDYLQKYCEANEKTVEENLNEYFRIRYEFFRENPHYEQIFRTAIFSAPTHLIDKIIELRRPLRQTNEKLLANMIERLDLKEGVCINNVVCTVLDFTDYVLVKQRKYNEDLEQKETQILIEEQNKTLMGMVNMVLYGIVK